MPEQRFKQDAFLITMKKQTGTEAFLPAFLRHILFDGDEKFFRLSGGIRQNHLDLIILLFLLTGEIREGSSLHDGIPGRFQRRCEAGFRFGRIAVFKNQGHRPVGLDSVSGEFAAYGFIAGIPQGEGHAKDREAGIQ